ncbi:CidA/LrgA family protein [Streptococcus sp. 20-1249]|uniref:CidA/LrgA family protein n=1 Tax=Streptococcus hepaticus TaxID=3349163 RepID=UPI003749539B
MKIYVQLMIILFFSFAGEVISTVFNLPVPGSIIGLILLFLALEFKWIRLRHIDKVGSFLLANMTILFLSPAVGILENVEAIKPYLLPIILIIGGALVLNITVISLVVRLIKNRYEGDFEEGK